MSHSPLFKKIIYKKFPKQTEFAITVETKYNGIIIKKFLACNQDKNLAYKRALKESVHLLFKQYIISERTLNVLNSKADPEIKFNALTNEYLTLFNEDKHTKIVVKKRPVSGRVNHIVKTKRYSLKEYNYFYNYMKSKCKFNSNDNGPVNVFVKNILIVKNILNPRTKQFNL